MATEPQIVFDEATGRVVELVPQEVAVDNLDQELAVAADLAQNRLNEATELVNQEEANYAAQVREVEQASVRLELARKHHAVATEEVAFQSRRAALLREAVQRRAAALAAGSETDAESVEPSSSVAEQEVQVHLAEVAPV